MIYGSGMNTAGQIFLLALVESYCCFAALILQA
jgi:hypothetical protein